MKILYGLQHLKQPLPASVVTVGVFDGVHRAHQAVIRRTVAIARRRGIPSVVVTFDPHPLQVLARAPSALSLTSLDHRLRLIGRLGVDIAVVIHFTKAFARRSGRSFVRDVLLQKLGMRHLVVGENFYFGSDARSAHAAARQYAREFAFAATIVPSVRRQGKAISSSRIRALVTAGCLDGAAQLLGRRVSILGTIVHGLKRGRELGFPTANINPHHEVIPPSGVYVVVSRIGKRMVGGVLNIGVRPTFHWYDHTVPERTVEVHFFNLNRSLYGKEIEVVFVKRLRPERRFHVPEHLSAQIQRDAVAARTAIRTKRWIKNLYKDCPICYANPTI